MLIDALGVFSQGNKLFKQKNRSSDLNFSGIPYSLPETSVNSGEDAVRIFGYFRLGNYLDSNDDDICPNNKKIREQNLKFLDKLCTQQDKRIFIDYYKNLTGFPDLNEIDGFIKTPFYTSDGIPIYGKKIS